MPGYGHGIKKVPTSVIHKLQAGDQLRERKALSFPTVSEFTGVVSGSALLNRNHGALTIFHLEFFRGYGDCFPVSDPG